MIGNKAFRIALLVSITAHSAILTPWPNLDSIFKKAKTQKDNTIEVNYLEIKVIPRLNIEEKVAPKIPTNGEISERREKVEIKESKAVSAPEPAKEIESVKLELQKPGVEISAKQPKEAYVDYYNLIREKLKFTLFKMYRPRFNKGEVYLEFTLHSDGALDRVSISEERSTRSQELKDITVRALQKSSPFPPLPEELSEPQVNFNVVISFRQ